MTRISAAAAVMAALGALLAAAAAVVIQRGLTQGRYLDNHRPPPWPWAYTFPDNGPTCIPESG